MKSACVLLSLSFGFCFSLFAGAQAGITLLVKTDMSCDWKLDGQPMGPLMADDSRVVLVSAGKHLIEAAATDGIATVSTNVKVDKVETTFDIRLKGRHDQESKMLSPEPPPKPTASESRQNPTWTDPTTGLMWTGKDNGSDVDYPQATAYCSKLQYAGYDGWRLPTTEELQGIYDPKVTIQKTFDNGRTYDVHLKGNIDITGNHWSSSRGRDLGEPYETSWEFSFAEPIRNSGLSNPFLNFTHYHYDVRALCVRRPEK